VWTPNPNEALLLFWPGRRGSGERRHIHADQATRHHLRLSPLGLRSPLTHTSPPPRHAPENSHVASVPSLSIFALMTPLIFAS